MTVTPDQADLDYLDTEAAEEGTYGYMNSPTLTDANDNIIGTPANAYTSPPTDSYGYQSIAGSDNNYNPYVSADGTDLGNVSATGNTDVSCNAPPGFENDVLIQFNYLRWDKWRYTIVGEYHINWDGTGGLSYEQGATSNIGTDVGADGYHFHFDFYTTYSNTDSSASGVAGAGPYTAGQVSVAVKYYKIHSIWAWVPSNGPRTYDADADDHLCKSRYFIIHGRPYDPGNGFMYITWPAPGSDASHDMWSQDDGTNGFRNDFPRSYHYLAPYGANGFLCVMSGKGYTYGWAASFGNVGIHAETDHSSDTDQCDYWKAGTRKFDAISGKKDGNHWVWGSNAKPRDNPKIFANY